MPSLTRVKPVGVVLTVYEVWRRLPAHHRARLYEIARREGMKVALRHGPRVAASLARRRPPPPP